MKDNFNKLSVLLLAILIAGSSVYSGPRKKIGTMAAPELLIPLGSIGTALQGSNLSSVTGVDAMYWNPAGITQTKTQNGEALFSYMNYFADINMQYVAGIVKIGNLGVLGASIRNLDFGEPIKVADEYNPEGTGETISPVYLIGNLSLAKAMTDKVHFGANIKIISEKIGQVSAVGYAFDFGLQYVAGPSGLRFGVALKNLGPSMRFDGPGLDRQFVENGIPTIRRVNLQDFDIPTSLEIGLSYTANFGKVNNVSVSSAFQNSGFTSDEYRFGLEYNYNNYVFLRGAYTYYADKDSDELLFGPSFGAGVKYPFGSIVLGFDYAYRITKEEGFDSHNQFFTLNVGF